jgi:hypothetical protein
MVMFNSLPAALGFFTVDEIRALAVTIAVRAPLSSRHLDN